NALQCLHEVKQLDRRKLPKPLLHILLLPLEEDPAGDLVKLAAHEMDAAPHGADGGVRLPLEVDVPALLAAFQLAHVLAVFGRRHGPTLRAFVASASPGEMSP